MFQFDLPGPKLKTVILWQATRPKTVTLTIDGVTSIDLELEALIKCAKMLQLVSGVS